MDIGPGAAERSFGNAAVGWSPPAGARFAHWRIRYSSDGTLLFAEEVWYDAQLKPIPSPKKLLDAFTPPNELTPESQHGF